MTSPNFKLFEQPNWGDDNTGERVWLKNRYAAINGNGYLDIPNADGNFAAGSAFEEGWYTITCVDTDGTGALEVTVDKMKQTVWDAAADSNLWLTANLNNMDFYFATGEGWSPIDPAKYSADGNHYYLTFPEALGALQWQAQVKYKTLGFSTSADKTYDFQVKILSSEDHPSITIKLVKEGDDNTYYCTERHAVKADEEFVYRLDNVAGIDMEDVQLVFDFGGGVGGSTLEYYDIIFQEHRAE